MAAPLPLGLIGLGKHGRRYLEHALRDVAGVRVAALSRRDAAAGRSEAASLGARFHADYRDLIHDPAVGAVVAVLPPTENPRVVEECVAAGRPLLIEKPLATSGAEAFALARRIREAGLPCLMAQTLRFSAVVRAVRELRPRLGRLSQVVLGQSFEPSRLAWLDDPAVAGGGNLLHTGVHLFDLARHLAEAEAEWALCATERVCTRRLEDSFACVLELRGAGGERLLAALSASRATRSRYGEIRLIGERGQIAADHVGGRVALLEDRRVALEREPADVPTVPEVLGEFVRVAAGAPPSVSADDGARAVEIADACRRSARSGRRERVRTEEEVERCPSS